MATFTIENIVVVAELGTRLPLTKIAAVFENTNYDPEQFPGLKLTLNLDDNKKLTFLVFNTGKLVITGGKKIEDAIKAIEEFRKKLKEKLNIETPDKYAYETRNMVSTGKFSYNSIDLLRLAEEEPDAKYNPEQFPGVNYRLKVKNSQLTFLLYANGNFVCTGGKTIEQIKEAIELMEKKLEKYAKK